MKNETDKMRRFFDQWQSQGISKQAFCNQNGLGYHKFNYWVKKFRPKQASPTVNVSGFTHIPIKLPVPIQQSQQIFAAIVFPSGVRLELFAVPEVGFLKEFIL
jgi:hypothetical protein